LVGVLRAGNIPLQLGLTNSPGSMDMAQLIILPFLSTFKAIMIHLLLNCFILVQVPPPAHATYGINDLTLPYDQVVPIPAGRQGEIRLQMSEVDNLD